MTKRRHPRTIEKALVDIADVLPGGYNQMAELTERQAHYLRACGDPLKREQLSVRDAKVLDKACKIHGGGTPIFDHYAGDLDAEGALDPADSNSLTDHAVRVIRECGEACAAMVEAAQSNTPARRAEAAEEVGEALETLKRALPALIGREAYDRIFAGGVHHQTGPPRAH